MKLSTKLSLAFGFLALILIALGAFSLVQIYAVNQKSAEIAENWLPSITHVQSIDTMTSDFRINEVRHAYSENSEQMATYERTLDELGKRISAHIAEYEKLVVLPAERELVAEYLKAREVYRNEHGAMLKLSRAGKTAEAISVLDERSLPTYQKLSSIIGKIVALNSKSANESSSQGSAMYERSVLLIATLLTLSILLAIALAIYIVRGTLLLLGKDPGELGAIARSVAAGNLDLKPEGKPQGVYLDILAMVENLKKNIEAAQQESDRAKEESYRAQEATIRAEAAGKEAAAKAQSIMTAAIKLEEVAATVSSASEELSAQVEQSERGAAEQAARMAEMATAMEEMNTTVLEVARNAGEASDATERTREKAESGAELVGRTVENIARVQSQSEELKKNMATLGQHASSISEIMGVISDIADQTNLLALNAAIEAARAGDAGRGFAVVADEVRKLAEKTMASTTDVGNAIKAIQESAERNICQVDAAVIDIKASTDLATQSGVSLKEIVNMVDGAADQVRAIATASEEQSATSEEINRAVTQVNGIAAETARAMQESAQAVSALASQAQVLSRLIEEMRRDNG